VNAQNEAKLRGWAASGSTNAPETDDDGSEPDLDARIRAFRARTRPEPGEPEER
jgi:hypothetical protein